MGISLENINKRNEKINKELTRVRNDFEEDEDDGSAFRQTATKSTNAWYGLLNFLILSFIV